VHFEIGHVDVPRRPRAEEDAELGSNPRIFVQCAGADYHRFAGPSQPGHRGAAVLAESGAPVLGARELEPFDLVLSSLPAELVYRDEDVGRVRRACLFPAPAAVTVLKSTERSLDTERHRATHTRASGHSRRVPKRLLRRKPIWIFPQDGAHGFE